MRILLSIPLGLLLWGCMAEVLTTTAIQGELQAQQLKAMRGQVQRASGTTGRIYLEKAIDTYRAEEGTNPPSLEVLVPDYLPALPTATDGSAYGYDPSTGQLLEGGQTGGGVSDTQKIEQIRGAINQYGTAVGFYPPTLDALVPQYLSAVPRSAAGQEFIYNNQNGYLAAPETSTAGQNRPAGGVAMGGAGPMGEVMTGIGMQNQLNSMSNGGSGAAGSYGRQAIGNATGTHNDQQDKVMDNLGL